MKAARTAELNVSAQDSIDLAISSEAPVERYFGMEILDHSVEAVDLSRLNDGRHPLLLNHDPDRQIGVIERAYVDKDKKLRGKARFGRSSLAQEIRQDVADGIRSLVSVGYMVNEVKEMKRGEDGVLVELRTLSGEQFEREMREKHGEAFYRAGASPSRAKESQSDVPTFVVTRWQPFEASVVPIPADVEVGVGRSGVPDEAPAVDVPAPAEPAAEVPPTTSPERIEIMEQQKPVADGADAERARVSSIVSLGEQFSKFVGQREVSDAIRNGRSAEQFKDQILAAMESKAADVSQREIGMTKKEVERYSLARALVASVTGDWSKAGFEREASNAVGRLFGRSAEGFFVPFEYFHRDFNIGTSSEAGNLRPTDLRTDLYVDALRANMVLAGMGVRILPGLAGNVDIPRKAVASTLGMLAEIGSATESNPTTAKATLSPKRIGAYIEVSKQALIQSAMPLEAMLRDDLLMGAANLIENQAFNGVGSNSEFTGLRNVASIGTVVGGSNGAALAWSHLVDLESACANSNAEPGALAGYIVNTKTRGKAKQITKSTYLPWLWADGATPLNGYRVGVTNNLPSNLTKGTSTTVCSPALFSSDWSMAVLGLFGAPDIVVDPYSKADTGQVKITLNQFADMVVRQPAAFAKIEDIVTG